MFAQQTIRLYDQDHDQNRKYDRIGQLCGNVRFGKDLNNAEQDTADHCAGNGTDAAKYSCSKCLDAGHGACGGHKGRIGGAEQYTCDGRQTGADGKGQGNGCIDIDTHQTCSSLVFRNCAHRRSHFCLVGEKSQTDHDQDAGKDRNDRDAGNDQLSVKKL